MELDRLLSIARECIAKLIFQFTEPRLVVTPLIQSFPIDRLTDLFGARRFNAPDVLVKLKARVLKRQSEEIQDTSHTALKIIDDVLVVDAQYLARQGVVPMFHEVEIGSVLACDVIDAVAELLPARE